MHMTMIKWTPLLEPLDEMDHSLAELLPHSRNGFTPSLDVYETKDEVVAEMPLPGVDPEHVDVSIENGVLTVQGRSERTREVDEKNYWRKEMKSGSFYRSISLPTAVVGDDAHATYEKGVLKISVPKAEGTKAKKVSIKVK